VFWRSVDPGNPDAMRAPRYLGIGSIKLEVGKDRRYAFKLRSPPVNGWEGPHAEVPGYREVSLVGGLLKRCRALPVTNGCHVQLQFVIESQPTELTKELADLSLLDEVLVTGWLVDRDMFAGDQGKDEDEVGDEDEDDDQDAENAPE
jgi:hypothetical protein